MFEIIKIGNKFKVCKKNKKECYSKKGIPKINAIKQLRAIGMTLKGNDIKEVEENSISDTEIRHYLPNARIIEYPDLKNYETIEELLPEIGSYIILLYLDTPNSGHWVTIKRDKNGINYFCSYGTYPDGQLKWYGEDLFKKFNGRPYLTDLFNKTKLDVYYNDIDYQSKKEDIVTCGRHVLFFIKSGKDLKDYFKSMKKGKGSFDEKVSKAINVILD